MTAVWVGVLVLFLALMYAAMWRGWQHRLARQSAIRPLPVPPVSRPPLELVVEGVYISTTSHDAWLDRIAARGLGLRSTADLLVDAGGIEVRRDGVPPLWIPRPAVVDVRDEKAQAGKVRSTGGITLITWDHQGALFDTGFAARYRADGKRMIDVLSNWAKETVS